MRRLSDVPFSGAGYCKAEAFAFNPLRDLVLSSLIEGICFFIQDPRRLKTVCVPMLLFFSGFVLTANECEKLKRQKPF